MDKNAHQTAFIARLHPSTIEKVWDEHTRGCKRCALYVEDETSTLAHVCPEGLEYLHVLLAKHAPKPKRQKIERPENWASKEEIKRVMRYK